MWMPSLADLRMLGPLWSLAGTIVAILFAALLVGRNYRVAGSLAGIGGIVTAALGLKALTQLPGPFGGISPNADSPMLVVDQFSMFFILLLSVFMVLVTGMWFTGIDMSGGEDLGRRRDAVEF